MTTTQETYLHVIQELENKDIDIVMRLFQLLFNLYQQTVAHADEG